MEAEWLELGNLGMKVFHSKKKLERVTFQQKEFFLSFMSENPEMITHSSTRESERVLWDELVSKLNNMKPEKTHDFWKMFWNKWIKGLDTKPENSLTMLDYKLKKFLKNLGFNSGEKKEKKDVSKLSITEINESLKKLKEERSRNKLEIDELDYKIVKLKKQITEMKNQIKEKKKLNTSFLQKQNCLNKRRRMLEESADRSLDTSTGS